MTEKENRKERFWTIGALRHRGWTDELISALLPPPNYRTLNGRRVRTWNKDLVLQKEQDRQFLSALRKEAVAKDSHTKRINANVQAALEEADLFLKEAWASKQEPDISSEARILALFYHQAILQQIQTVTWADKVKHGQAASYIGFFLAMRKQDHPTRQNGEIKRLISAAPWIGRNPEAPQVKRLFAYYGETLLIMAQRELDFFRAAQPEADVAALLDMDEFPTLELLSHSLGYIYSVIYVPQAIRTSLETLVALNPKDEYPEARAMKRHFVLHIGGTNTGKTYAGFQRLKAAMTGVYLAPLRLLALEAQEIMLDAGVACSLTTGEEEDRQPGDTHIAATAEKLELKQRFDVAVIDECQMIGDRVRGYAWTRAILGVLAPEVHLCAAPEAKHILIQLIKSCGDSYEVVQHQRKTPLLCMTKLVDYTRVQPGDALITFSKIGVLSIAEDLRQRGKEPAIIYGALPYSTRRKQVQAFLRGDTQYVVSTDAIGMGLNLPIRRIIFMDTEKFDGTERRDLKPEEIQQIAGRAGRYGMYDKGFVGATQNLSAISTGLKTVVPPLTYAVTGFSDLVLTVDFDLLEVLEVWNRMPTADPYIKIDISRYISIISRLRDSGFQLTKEQELRAANIPFDETEEALYQLFHHFLRQFKSGNMIDRPVLPEKKTSQYTLPELELYCRKLDLYFSFSKAFDIEIDRYELHEEREQVADWINQILLHNLKNNIRFCSACGTALPLHHSGRLCTACYNRRSFRGHRR